MRASGRTDGLASRRRANETGPSSIRESAMQVTATIESPSKRLEHLLGSIAAGKDQNAFEELYAATRRKLFSTVLLVVGRADLAEEILQEAFVRIWSNASAYRPERGTAMTWMIAIARNIAIDHARRPMREACSDETALLQLPTDDPTALEAIEALEDQQAAIHQRQIALSALQTLDPAKRDLVIAAYIDGKSREQLAKLRGVPVNTVKTWIRRALLEIEATARKPEKQCAPRIAANAIDARPAAQFLGTPIGQLGRHRTCAPQLELALSVAEQPNLGGEPWHPSVQPQQRSY